VVAVALGILLGFAIGGSLRKLGNLKLRGEWFILPLFLIQAISRGRLFDAVGASDWSLAVWAVASSALVLAMVLNWRIPGMALGAAGILMNLNVVIVNQAMPVLIGWSHEYGAVLSAAEIVRASGGFYRAAAQGDIMVWLGDLMPVAIGRDVLLLSPGDVVLMVAIAVTISNAMLFDGEGSSKLDSA
jgi:hypothetical protein